VHVGGHVAGVDGVDPQPGVLHGEDGGQLVEGGLAGAVATPAGVGLDGGVGADVDDGAAGVAQRGEDGLHERERGHDVDGEEVRELVGRQVGQGGQRTRAERARVVDQEVEPRSRGLGQRGAVPRVGDVARDRGDAVRVREGGPGGVQPWGVPAVDDEPPAAVGERGGEGSTEAARGAGDQCGAGAHGVTVGPQVHLRSRGARDGSAGDR
jgi:hypothetical protein